VPHNLISAQDRPVPVPKFQMTPRFKILKFSGSKKGTQMYYPFLSKVPASKSPPGSPVRSLWREMPISRDFLNISSRVPSKGALHRGPLQRASSERITPLSTKLATHHYIPQDFNLQQSFNEIVDNSVIRSKDTPPVAYRGAVGVFKPPPPPNSEVLTQLNRIANRAENV
jgi:hypothetical protein